MEYESEEDEFLRELEDMRSSLQNSEQEDEVPQDPAPILSVLCSLVDEIGSLRTENRRLKIRLAPTPSRSKNVVQRVSAIFDSHTSIFPRLRRAAHAEIRTGARERLSTPPRKDPLTTSSISTDFSQASTKTRAPPLVQPELSDSEVEDYPVERRNRRTAARRCDMSMSECTSPSSASSSRDPSEAMTSSRSSFLELIGFRRRTVGTSSTSLLPATKPILKKRKRRVSEDETSGLYANIDNSNLRQRPAAKPPRPVSYYPVEDSDDSDNLRTKRKATSFLNVHNKFDNTENLLRVERETRLRHDKENLEAEIEELKMRNQRLVDQLRDKSAQFSKLQFHAHKLDEQIESLSQRCALNAALDKMTLEERFLRGPLTAMEKIEDRLRLFQRQVQSAKLDVANAQQKTMNNIAHERNAHQACLDRLEDLQRENFALMQSRYLESGCDDSVWQRKIDALPAYEALYSFAQHAVRKYSDLRWMLLEREREASRAELDLIAAQSSLLITHAQNERFRIKLGEKRPKRPASFHGEDLLNRVVKREMNFFLPFKMQGSRVENSRRILNKKSNDNEKDLESEFFALFGAGRNAPPTLEKPPTAVSRIEYMMREMSQNKNRKAPTAPIRNSAKTSASRPISLVEVEEQRRSRRFDDTRRSIKVRRQPSMEGYNQRPIDTGQVPTSSLQELPFHSPAATPATSRKFPEKVPYRLYDQLPEKMKGERVRQLERGYSMEAHDRPTYSEEMRRVVDERKRDERERIASTEETEQRKCRIQRQPPVHLTRIRPPSYVLQRKTKTLDGRPDINTRPSDRHPVMEVLDPPRASCTSPPGSTSSRLPKPDKKSWLDKIRNMKRS
ncbi:hypothetical protein GCK32_004838 [Trichostrongylus colubriformis]|uniref:Uncharacterized protein n=1 Tax=Trichostrongylus colubriformis TaxID=6319 RepID=A0AAN8J2X5_TRICO